MTPSNRAKPGCDPQAAADLLRALAHPMRLQILCRLLEGEVSVSGFESELGLKQPNLSQQLAQLREAYLVTTRREAKSVYYRLADPRVQNILDALRQALSGPISAPPRPAARPPVAARPARKTLMLSAPMPSAPLPSTPMRPTRVTAAAECGVFSIAGWPAHD
jgi:DNA-binding transcriptional ArsR family regulator